MTRETRSPRSPDDPQSQSVGQTVGQTVEDDAEVRTNPNADQRSITPAHVSNLPATRPTGATSAKLDRSSAMRVRRLREEMLRGNDRAQQFGVFRRVALLPDVALEIEATFIRFPALDRITDRRLVERVAADHVRYMRVLERIEDEELSMPLQAAARDFGNRSERGEARLYEREHSRVRDFRSRELVDVSAYQRPQRRGKS